MGRIAGRGTKLQNKLHRAGLSLGVFAGTFVLAFMAASIFAPVDASMATDSGSSALTMSFTSAQTINIAVDKTAIGLSASGTDFGKMLTDSLNVTVSTNNLTGYTLSMTTDSSATNGATIDGTANVATNALVNTADNKFYLPSISTAITNPTDTTFPVNTWAYSTSTTPANMVYNPLPAANASAEIKKVAELEFPTNGGGTVMDDVTPVTVAAKADMSVPAGSYTNKLIFTAITNFNEPIDNYRIVYDANGGTGEMAKQSLTPGADVTLSANTFTGSTNFLGWSTDKDAETATYTNGQTITGGLSNEGGKEITLYAVWEKLPVYHYVVKAAAYNPYYQNINDISEFVTVLDQESTETSYTYTIGSDVDEKLGYSSSNYHTCSIYRNTPRKSIGNTIVLTSDSPEFTIYVHYIEIGDMCAADD